MTIIRDILLCALIAVLIAVGVCAVRLIRTLEQVTAATPIIIASEVAQTRQCVDQRMASIQASAVSEIRATRAAAIAEIAATRADITSRLASVEHRTDMHLFRITAAMDMHMATANGSLAHMAASVDPAAALVSDVHESIRPHLQCRGNGACWPAQVTAAIGAGRQTLGETSRTMRAVREAAPKVTANVQQTTANVERITRPDSWLVRGIKLAGPVLGGALAGAIR